MSAGQRSPEWSALYPAARRRSRRAANELSDLGGPGGPAVLALSDNKAWKRTAARLIGAPAATSEEAPGAISVVLSSARVLHAVQPKAIHRIHRELQSW
jgi:hypothetical protein